MELQNIDYTIEDFLKDHKESIKSLLSEIMWSDYLKDCSGVEEVKSELDDSFFELFYEYDNHINVRIFMASLMIMFPSTVSPYHILDEEYMSKINIFNGEFVKMCGEFMNNINNFKGEYLQILSLAPTSELNFSRVTMCTIIIDAIENLGECENLGEFFQSEVDRFKGARQSIRVLKYRENFLVELFIKIRGINVALDYAHYTEDSNVEFKGSEYWITVEKINEIYKYLTKKTVELGDKEVLIKHGLVSSEYLYMDYAVSCYLMQKYNYSEGDAFEYSLNYCLVFKNNVRSSLMDNGREYLVDIFKSVDDDLDNKNDQPLAWLMFL